MTAPDPTTRIFLNVERSITGRKWSHRLSEVQERLAKAIWQQHDVDQFTARLLAGRDVALQDVPAYLDPTIRRLLPNPATLMDARKAAERIAAAIVNSEPVAIFADYDVDGATAAALLGRYLQHFGLVSPIHVPDRLFEGYGPNEAAVTALRDTGATLLITVDCGTTSAAALAHAGHIGFDVVVLDHHQCDGTTPTVTALVNPNRPDDLSGQGHLAAVGVVFITLVCVNSVLRDKYGKPANTLPPLLSWLDLVALGTVCDVVPLRGVNRAFVAKGLIPLRQRTNCGLRALGDVARLTGPPRADHLGFILGPRINAGGRIGDAALGARLLMTDDDDEARAIATQLDALNQKRRAAEAAMLADAQGEVAAEIGDGDGPAVIVTARGGWHPGLVGLLAARLKERYGRAAIAIGFDENDLGVGSGRSISGVDLGAAVIAARQAGILEKGGGHAMAAGLTVRRQNLSALRAFLEKQLGAATQKARLHDVLTIDAALTASGATVALCKRMEQTGPFGAGSPAPLFAFATHRISFAKRVGENHVRCRLSDSAGGHINAIAFRAADTPLGDGLFRARQDRPLHIAARLNVNVWRGEERVEIAIVDAAEPHQL